jgi:uncharacterized protein (DUF1015 family)
MPELKPFRAVRYSAARDLSALIAPPYDVISPPQREALARRDPHNIVHLILPEERPGGPDKYQLAGERYRKWLGEDALTRESVPALYALHQRFSVEGRSYVRRGFLARLLLYDFKAGVVLPHEKTLSGPKADRLRLFQSVRANLSPIFALYPDDSQQVESLFDPALSTPATWTAHGDDGVESSCWRVEDPALIARVAQTMLQRKAYIADGHHRYETGLRYAELVDQSLPSPQPRGGHHYILSFFCGMSDPGLLILPTHRLLHGISGFDAKDFLKRAGQFFDSSPLPTSVHSQAGLQLARDRLATAGKLSPSLLLVLPDESHLLVLKAEAPIERVRELPKSKALRKLDVTLLHGLLLQHVLGLSPESQERQENLRYVKDASEAVAAVRNREAQAAIILNATAASQVREVAEAGEVMPQKSTFFYPKLPSGLVMNPLDPSEPAGSE